MVINIGDTAYALDQWQPGQPVITGAQLAVDTETELIIKGTALKPVLIQVCDPASRRIQIAQYPHFNDYIRQLLEANATSTYIFFNAPFDIEAMGLGHDARMLWMAENSRIVDMAIRFILHELQRGTFIGAWSLDFAAKRILQIIVPKDDEIRLGFKQDMELTPPFISYAATDAAITAQLFQHLPNALPTEDIQLCGFLALHAASNNGMLVDDKYRLELKQDFERREEECKHILRCWGYYPKQKGNTKVLQEAMEVFEKHCNVIFSRTEKKQQIQVGEEVLEYFDGQAPPSLVSAYQDHAHCSKMVSTYLSEDNIASDRRIHPFFSPLVKTGRTSASKPNIQNIPRKERIRGIYIAPEHHLLYAADYRQIELGALAQSCYTLFDQSRMMELLNAGEDIHSWFGEIIKNHDERPDKVKEDTDYRQMAKAVNFGIPGGLGPATLRKTAKKNYDVDLSMDQAIKLRSLWLETFPEMTKHLSPPVDNESPWDSPMYIGRTINGRTRRNATFAAACNYPFQGLVADGAKLALWLLYKEGFKTVSFIHDEVITELAKTRKLQQRINRINELMIFAMKRFLPNIKVEVEGVLMSRWYKEAEPVFDAGGNLQEWTPNERPKLPKGRLI